MDEEKSAGIRGWVYVITNAAMPNLVKVGFSLKDPNLRARKLNHTGAPHPYTVEYDVLVRDPRFVEQQAHARLSSKLEAKEWFRCTVAEAVEAVLEVAGSRVLLHLKPTPTTSASVASTATTPAREASPSPVAGATFKRTGTYAGRCNFCGLDFSVTLTRFDSGARCPHCLRMNDTAAFQRKEFLI